MTHLKKGDKAPFFAGVNEKGEKISLANFEGKKLILFFYPKDNTPTCTTEVCNIRDNYDRLKDEGFELLGVSPDSQRKHQNFIRKFDLPFPLLADTEKIVAKAYGVWGPKKMFGKLFNGVYRTTFVIDEQQNIVELITKVEASNHSNQILDLMGIS